jgi:hypothetical protein
VYRRRNDAVAAARRDHFQNQQTESHRPGVGARRPPRRRSPWRRPKPFTMAVQSHNRPCALASGQPEFPGASHRRANPLAAIRRRQWSEPRQLTVRRRNPGFPWPSPIARTEQANAGAPPVSRCESGGVIAARRAREAPSQPRAPRASSSRCCDRAVLIPRPTIPFSRSRTARWNAGAADFSNPRTQLLRALR